MSSASSTTRSGGIGIAGALGLLFIGLKLAGVITWSWLWVLSPFWIPLALVLVILLIMAIILGIAMAAEKNRPYGTHRGGRL